MNDIILGWAVVFVEHGLTFQMYTEEWEARAVCNAINSDNTGNTSYGRCRVVPLCEGEIQPPKEETAKYWRDKMWNNFPATAGWILTPSYVALRNMFMRLKTPTMNGYPEIGDIKNVIEEALIEWRKDKDTIFDLEERLKND